MKGKHIVASALAVTICLMGCSNNKQADIDAEVTKLEEEAKKTLQDVQEYSKEDIEKATTYIHENMNKVKDDEVVKNLIKAGTYLEAADKAGATESSQKLAKLGKDIHTYASDVYKAADDKKDAIIKESSNMISSWKDTLNKEKNKLIDEFQKFINH